MPAPKSNQSDKDKEAADKKAADELEAEEKAKAEAKAKADKEAADKKAAKGGKGSKIKSNYEGPLGLPNGPVINPGATALVENWGSIKDHTLVKAWLSAKVIEVVK